MDLLSKKKILEEYGDVFDTLSSLRQEPDLEAEKSIQPVQYMPQKIPVPMREEIMKKIDELIGQKIVAKVNETPDWISSMVVFKKPQSNKLRICIEPLDFNQVIQKPIYPQLTIGDIIPQLSQAKGLSVLDAKDGFWEIKLDKENSYLTAFWSPCGKLRWLRMPFGIHQKKMKEDKLSTFQTFQV